MNENQLVTESTANKSYSKITFMAFWIISASTTYLFGATYLATMWSGIVGIIPLDAGIIQVVSSLLGGFSALLLLDIAYIRWQHIGRKCSQSSAQIKYAKIAETASFYISLSYSGTVLISTAFKQLTTPSLLVGIEWYGLITIVGIVTLHLICYRQWQATEPSVAVETAKAKIAGMMQDEQLQFKEDVAKAGLLEARKLVQEQSKSIATSLAVGWSQELINSILPQATQAPQAPQTSLQVSDAKNRKDVLDGESEDFLE